MAIFGLGNYKQDFGGWAKHHKEVSIHVRREYEDDRENVEADSEELRNLVKENEDKLMSKHVSLMNFQNGERSQAIDYYLPLHNLDYKERNLEHYSIGASNTKQTTKMRFIFKVEELDFALDYSYDSEGHYATSFYNLLFGFDGLKDIIYGIAENEKLSFTDKGIKVGKEEDFYIVGVDENKHPMEFEINERELIESLVAVEVYEHDMEIM